MTSVNESNAEQRGITDGYKLGHEIGHAKGYSEALESCYKEKRTLRLYQYVIAFIIGFVIASIFNQPTFAQVHAQSTIQTSVTVLAEVPCNTTNCPVVQVVKEDTAQEQTLLQRIWSAILKALT